VTLWVGKRWLGGAPVKNAGGSQMRVNETLALGRRCSLSLVAAGKQQVLVGLDGAGLKALVALAEPFESTPSDLQGAGTLARSAEPVLPSSDILDD
jgi:hypothetical protein